MIYVESVILERSLGVSYPKCPHCKTLYGVLVPMSYGLDAHYRWVCVNCGSTLHNNGNWVINKPAEVSFQQMSQGNPKENKDVLES